MTTVEADGQTTQRSIPEMSIDTRLLIELLEKAEEGQTIDYSEMEQAIGRDVRDGARGNLQTARRRLRDDKGIQFGTVQGIGIKRLTDVEVVDSRQSRLDHIRRTSKVAVKELAAVDFDTLPNETKVRHNAYFSMFGALHQVTKANNVKRLETKVGEAQSQLSLARTLDAFKE